ncbi:urease subunit beta/urease subunit gamma/beta [Clostridium algifaecis]|uniref:Urease subunit beta n=1 Tax=Clostridium algifaecis TaxID=1472040 RepID=A0ABS4KQL5_9CLOT|nr:urease subunit beta/urease subunit gamma/beta [Clostridium algifaecis]
MIPGEIILKDEDIILNEGRKTLSIIVANKGDRPIQVGSHFHFFEVNKCLEFHRAEAFGMRLDIPSGTAVRFEPGEEKKVQLTEIGGNKFVKGLNGLTNGYLTALNKEASLKKAFNLGFKGVTKDEL